MTTHTLLFEARMRAEGLPEIVIETFKYYYAQLIAGQTGYIPEADIQPVEALPDAEAFGGNLTQTGLGELRRVVIIKLNGGLGTGMGLDKAKSLLPVKEGLSFLDIIARQAIHAGVPLVLMNSFVTQADSLAVLKAYPELWENDLGLDFVQHKFPKVNQASFAPAEWPQTPHLEWNPPGHGDIYTALITSGMLDQLLNTRYKYAFVSNSDNLGAVMDMAILGYFAQYRIPLMMEVADRTETDKKGGHLAQRPDGQLLLRESAQCPPEDKLTFQNVTRHKYFNTNNLWINLPALKASMRKRNNILGLPLIRNAKTVDPQDRSSTPIYQLETAMGSAIAVFEGAQAVRVPRTRFAPVKTTNDLLAVRSDAYSLTGDYRVVPNPARQGDPPVVDLDARYYKLIDDLEARFPQGAPSLAFCSRLSVEGDFRFGKNITIEGNTHLQNLSERQVAIENDSVFSGKKIWN